MNTFGKKGFTLIELLVVIAIIGVLSSVVLSSLNVARTRAADSAVRANLATIRVQAELYYDERGLAYGTPGFTATNCLNTTGAIATSMFNVDPTIRQAIRAAVAAGRGWSRCAVVVNGQSWAAVVRFRGTGGLGAVVGLPDPEPAACVDSTGASRRILEDEFDVNLGGGAAPARCP